MKRLFQELLGEMEQGRDAVLVTIIASSGSTPRGAGSRMLVKADGTSLGTIGGGTVEYRATRMALEAMKEKSSRIQGFTLNRNQAADIGMICGGDVVVYFQYIDSANQACRELCGQISEALGKDEDSYLILDITDSTCWKMGLYTENGGAYGMEMPEELLRAMNTVKECQREIAGRKYYVEPLVMAGSVYVFGGGHVAQELVPVLSHLGFRCIVMDDMEEFAYPSVFPTAEKTVTGDLERISEYVSVRPCDYVCIMTRGHQYDYYIQRQMLEVKPCYIGIMGSRNKIKVVTEKLMADGFSREEIEKCHMPIGTAIGAVTPAEIAVSIAGELIAVRAERRNRR